MHICNGIIQFNPIQNFNYLERILFETSTVNIKKYPKTLLELKFKNFWV